MTKVETGSEAAEFSVTGYRPTANMEGSGSTLSRLHHEHAEGLACVVVWTGEYDGKAGPFRAAVCDILHLLTLLCGGLGYTQAFLGLPLDSR